jgi:NADPH-dependent ferric siderophore reductase
VRRKPLVLPRIRFAWCYRKMYWTALESQSARAVRRYLVEERHFDKHWVKAAGYWRRDAVGVHEVFGY